MFSPISGNYNGNFGLYFLLCRDRYRWIFFFFFSFDIKRWNSHEIPFFFVLLPKGYKDWLSIKEAAKKLQRFHTIHPSPLFYQLAITFNTLDSTIQVSKENYFSFFPFFITFQNSTHLICLRNFGMIWIRIRISFPDQFKPVSAINVSLWIMELQELFYFYSPHPILAVKRDHRQRNSTKQQGRKTAYFPVVF